MTRKEYVDEVRPLMRFVASLFIFIGMEKNPDCTLVEHLYDAYSSSEILINEFEKQFKFEEEE